MKKIIPKKNDGFQGQKAIVIPRKVLSKLCVNTPIISGLYITDIGYYPKARFHYRKRIHGAEENILIYCVEGSGSVLINKESFDIEPGDFFVVPRNVQHIYGTDESNPWTIYWIHFAGEHADAFVKNIREKFNGFKEFLPYSKKRIELFDTIYYHLQRGYSVENVEFANLCFNHFIGSCIYQENFNLEHTNQNFDIVNQAIDYMTNHIQSALSLPQLAENLNISPSHLSFLFKNKTGYPPIEYMNHLKVQKACQFLMFTPKRIKEIALEIGMDDPYYFSRFFKRQIGMSPHAYKLKMKKTGQ